PGTEATGPYRNLAENHAGAFHLTREEGTVYATFQTDRSPVQFLARDQPEVLFTVPEGFRPVLPVTWEVSAQPVLTDGTPHPDQPDRRVFRMRVDRQGHVRYVDDAGVDGVGHLRYHTMLAWPLAGTEPRLCERYQTTREAILEAVQALENAPMPCSQVGWFHLARIRTLSVPIHFDPDLARHALLGLTNLTTLQLRLWPVRGVAVPTKLLAHTPRLERLDVDDSSFTLPADLLLYTPLLAHLSLGNNPHRDLDLPDDLLMDTPHLETLHLEGKHPAVELAYAPRLTRLIVMPSTPLPETFLAAMPQLTYLTVRSGLEPCATPQLLASVPHLRHFAVRMPAEAGELTCLARSLQQHIPALDQLEVDLRDLQGLNTEILPSLPRLTRLTLDVAGATSLPEQMLARTPELTHLTLQDDTGRDTALTLPHGFFAHTPQLTALSLQVDLLNDLSPDLLTPLPGLQQLQIVTKDTTALSEQFLDQVTELRMEVGPLVDLPEDFLVHAPHLEVLHLDAPFLKSLPEHLLTYAPHLVELRLDVPSLEALPPSFLAHAPRLEVFQLDAGYSFRLSDEGGTPSVLYRFPEHLLTYAPNLVELHLRVPSLQVLPPSFLAHTPRLEKLVLEGTHDYYGKVDVPITSVPANFLTHAPRLRHLDLAALGFVNALPSNFLTHSVELRYLNLDANGVSSLPADFLAYHPRLESVRILANRIPILSTGFLSQSSRLVSLQLDLQKVEALPEDFLTETPRLQNVEVGVNRIGALPTGFLADAPHLVHLRLRALNLTAWPTNFLADAPLIQTLSLAMPLLEPTLKPDHRLWDVLQATSTRVKVTQPNPYYLEPDFEGVCVPSTMEFGDILRVYAREQRNDGDTLLRVRRWRNRELFTPYLLYYCPYLIDVRLTAPTLEVCEADRDPAECTPLREPYWRRNQQSSPFYSSLG
ncbi:MAG: hypothetical protein OXH72_10220, partial [Caldilineaceae bacterium]|nr:hypothetical protein [Caldilineaceae bacterium]